MKTAKICKISPAISEKQRIIASQLQPNEERENGLGKDDEEEWAERTDAKCAIRAFRVFSVQVPGG